MITVYPVDWPSDGVIDLSVHDLPHHSSTTEWWYLNSHCVTSSGRNVSLFASFFRIVNGEDPLTKENDYAHSLTWALIDLDANRYYAASLIDPRAPEIIRQRLEQANGQENRLRRALREVIDKGKVPRPDRLIENPVMVNLQELALDFGGDCFYKRAEGIYQLDLYHPELHYGCNLTFTLLKPPVRHGESGVVRGVANEEMFYYFIPRCDVQGTITIDSKTEPVVAGSGWYDHEFGRHEYSLSRPEDENPAEGQDDIAWNWISIQLDNGWEISTYDLFNTNRDESAGRWAVVIDPAGKQYQYTEFSFEALERWTSARTFNDYGTRWRLEIPDAQISLMAEAPFAEQEFVTIISRPAFWEGRVNVVGTFEGQSVSGVGFVECSGFGDNEDIETFLRAVSRQTRTAIQRLLPLEPTHDDAVRLIGSPRHAHYLTGLDVGQYARTVIKPLREITDRGGKAWRSYATVACCDLVGGDANQMLKWLAVPELFHVGSLIVDDVQDKSPIRRGGPSAHEIYGEPLAINAGTAAYFLGELIMSDLDLTDAERLQIYALYFETLRATHAGQALDIAGLAELMPSVVESGDGFLLERRLLAIHRLKSAVPARSLAMIGAIIGKGTEAQINALGDYFETLGLAFQIMDDTLNLRGFENNLKDLGEDVGQGKITMPVAKAMSRLSHADRQRLWTLVASKPDAQAVRAEAITLIQDCGALDACEQHAHELVETGWRKLDPLIEDSATKLMLRAFSWYVLERHY